MSKRAIEQLLKAQSCKGMEINDDTLHVFIPRKTGASAILQKGKYYRVQLEDYIINPPANFTLAENWNNNTKPIDKINNCEVIEIMGNMVKLQCAGFDISSNTITNNYWCGWVPMKAVKVLSSL